MLSVPPRMGLEYQLVAVQHIGIDRRVRRTPLANPFARDPQQHLPLLIMQVRRAQRADHFGGIRGGAGGHVPRFPSTVVARRSAPSRRLTITTVSPGWWLRRASVLPARILPLCRRRNAPTRPFRRRVPPGNRTRGTARRRVCVVPRVTRYPAELSGRLRREGGRSLAYSSCDGRPPEAY